MANYTSTHTGATIDASVTIISGSGVTQSDLIKLNAVTSTAVELNLLDGVTATTAELNILDGVTATATELNYLDGADSSITTLSLPDNTTITTFGASLIDDADAAAARTTLGVDAAGTDNSTNVTLVTTSHDYLSISGQAITLGSIDISDDTNLVGGDGLALTGDTLSVNVDDSSIEINSDTLRVKASGVTNAMLANSSVSYGGVSVALGASDATPSFDLSDATSLPIVAGTTGTLSVARGGTGATTASDARTNLNVDVAGTDNSTDVTLVTTSHDYLSLSGQAITLGTIDIGDDTNLVGGTGITLTGDTLSTTDSDIVHDNLSGFVANEHIDHSGVSITAGAGLTGGGDITATRDIAVGAGTGVTVNADDVAIGQDVATTADVTFNSVTADIIGDIRGATKFQAKADVALNKGDAVYISGVSGTTPTVDIADANDSAKMPSFGLAASSVSINASVEIITFGTLSGLNTSAFSVGDIIYISTNGTSGNTLTATAPSGESSLIQNIGIVQRSHASSGSIKVGGAGRTNATPNLDDGDIFIGNGSNQAVTASLNTKIEDYLDGGTSTANFDTISVDGAEITATPAELNVLDGITSTTAELNYTDGVTSNIQTQLDAKAPLASPAFTGTATGANLTLSGDLTVNGSTTTLDTTNLAVEDNLMELNAGVTSNANDSGFLIERGTTGDNAIFMWDESADKFTLGTTTATGTTTGDITLSSTGTLVASLEGNVTGDVTGNADTATTLATARNFSLTGDVTAGAVSFDGSGNVALSTTIAANSVALGTDTTGNYMSDLTEGTGIDITHTPAEGSNATITLDLTEVGFGGGANRLITDDGDGTVSTEANLTFDGSTLAVNDLNIRDDGSNTFVENSTGNLLIRNQAHGSKLQFGTEDSSGTLAYVLNITGDNHRVGIGTSSPSALLHLNEDDNVGAFLVQGGGGGLYLGRFQRDVGGSSYVDIHCGTDDPQITFTTSAAARQFSIGADSSANSFKISENSLVGTNDRFVIDDSGNVGIGTTSPSAYLHTEGASSGTESYAKFSTGSAAGDQILTVKSSSSRDHMALQVNTGAGATDDLALNPDGGNVGIGTTSPDYELDVAGDIGVDHLINHNGDTNTYVQFTTDRLRFAAGGEVLLDLYEDGTQDYVKLGDGGDVDINLNDDMFVEGSSGNVGIGTTSPGRPLVVNGSSATFLSIVSGENDDGGILFGDSSEDYSGQIRYNNASHFMFFKTNNAEVMRINSSGNVGIGTSSPSTKMHIKDASNNVDLRIETDKLNGNAQVQYLNDARQYNAGINNVDAWSVYDATAAETRFTINSSGNVGIGNTSPGALLDVGGDADEFALIGRARVGYNSHSDFASFQHRDSATSGGYALLQSSAGATYLNAASGQPIYFRINNSDVMHINSSGSVGIGTTSPSFKLKVNVDNGAYTDWETIAAFQTKRSADSETEAGIMINSLGDALGGQISSNYYWSDNVAARGNTGRSGAIFGMSNNAGAAGTHSSFYWQTSPNNSNTLTDRMILDTSGNLLIGASSNRTTVSGYSPRLNTEGAGAAGYVQIVDTENSQFHGGTLALHKYRSGGIAANTELGSLYFGGTDSANSTYAQGALIKAYAQGADSTSNVATDLAFFTNTGSAMTRAMTIDDSQNVGIGTTSPTQDLHLHRTGVGDDVYIQFTNGDTGSTSGDGLQIGLAGNEDARIIQKENSPLEFWTNNTLRASFEADGDFVPNGDGVYDLGASANRWAVVYSADLDLSNEGSQNDVDGTWGSYVIQEGEEDLFLINRRNGKKYKFMLQEVQD